VSKVQTAYPQVTSKQVHRAWRELSQTYWRRDELQLPSARKLLAEYPKEVDLFHVNGVLEDVELLAWGMMKIATPLKGQIVEIGMDATCKLKNRKQTASDRTTSDNTNAKHIELYSMMAEHDNAGFPLSYCLTSTATAIDQGK
jgi:hypothetical protein